MDRPIWSDWTCFGLVHSAYSNVCSNKDLGMMWIVNKLLFHVFSLHFFVRKRLIENDGPRLGFSEQLVNRNYLHLLTRLADLSLRTFLGRGWPFGLHFCGCNGGNTHMQSFLTPFRKLATIAILLAYS